MNQTNYIEIINELWHGLIRITHNEKHNKTYAKLKELSELEIGIISTVANNPDVIFKDIRERFHLPKSTLTNMIDRLEKKGYLKRVISERDRRCYGLELTKEGIAVEKEHIAYEEEILGKLIGALDTEEEKQMVVSILKKITDKLDK